LEASITHHHFVVVGIFVQESLEELQYLFGQSSSSASGFGNKFARGASRMPANPGCITDRDLLCR
ncbi:hypothetical protein BGX33_002654, partial [Mortierella sp. NVP41]